MDKYTNTTSTDYQPSINYAVSDIHPTVEGMMKIIDAFILFNHQQTDYYKWCKRKTSNG